VFISVVISEPNSSPRNAKDVLSLDGRRNPFPNPLKSQAVVSRSELILLGHFLDLLACWDANENCHGD
jgi:hypothetical protein